MRRTRHGRTWSATALVAAVAALVLAMPMRDAKAAPGNDLDCVVGGSLPVPANPELVDQAGALGDRLNGLARASPELALASYDRVLVMLRQASDPVGEALTLSNIGVLLRRVGRYDESLERHRQALELRRSFRDCALIAISLNNLGVTLGVLAREDEALVQLRSAVDIRRKLHDTDATARTLLNISLAQRRLGRYDEALARLYEAMDLGSVQAEGALRTAYGLVLGDLGRFAEARKEHAAATKFFQTGRDRLGLYASALNEGNAALSAGDETAAVEAFQHSLRYAVRPEDRAGSLMSTALALSRLGDVDSSVKTGREVLEILSELKDNGRLASAYGNLGLMLRRQSKHAEARASFMKVLELARAAGTRRGSRDVISEATALQALGELAETENDLATARSHYLAAVALREGLRRGVSAEELRSGFADTSTSLYERLVPLLMRMQRFEEAYEYAERARARSFVETLLGERMAVPAGVDQDAVSREQDLRIELAALEHDFEAARGLAPPGVVTALEQRLAEKRIEYDRILTRIRVGQGQGAMPSAVAPLSTEQVRRRLAAGTAIISYFVTADSTTIFLLTPSSFEARVSPVGRAALEELVRRFRNFNSRGVSDPDLADLYRHLIAPVSNAVAAAQIVGFVPHGALHYLPFAALTDGRALLGADKAVFYLPSADLLRSLRAGPVAPAAAMVMAHSRRGLQRLIFAEEEAIEIANVYGVKPILAGAASETALRGAAHATGVMHVAAHGLLNPGRPNFSRLMLSEDDANDGVLNVYEISGMDLSGVALVVLSACQTQLGTRSKGDELVSLNRTFLTARAQSVVASLWNVDDEAGTLLMQRFHSYLKDGLPKVRALQKAQADAREKYPDPFYWAGFVLNGDPGVGLAVPATPAGLPGGTEPKP